MQTEALNKNQVKENIEVKLSRYFGCTPEEASREQMYKAVAMTLRDMLSSKRNDFKHEVNRSGSKRVYYMSMEFLLGRSLKTNLGNLGLAEKYKEALKDYGVELDDLYECEPDAGLGNGGLGRLAACFMDSLTAQSYAANGYSLCYENGLFRQRLVDGEQVELPDIWMPEGGAWLVPRPERAVSVRFGGQIKESWENGELRIENTEYDEVRAVPYDVMIAGPGTDAVNTIRLWKAKNIQHGVENLTSQGTYIKAMEASANAEEITRQLYPPDNYDEGKLLRLTQQYFLVSASVQSIIRDHMAVYGTLDNLADKVAIHLNDTHPTLCIPELMRILVDDYFYPWDTAWSMVCRICSYTNHTVLPEALESWSEDLFRLKLPRIYTIVKEINERFCREAWDAFPGNWQRISKMSIVGYGQVRMANLAVVGSHSINGVSALHSQILKDSVFKDFYRMYPDRFDNVTNGIAHRRWLCYSNPGLTSLLDECIGTGYRKNPVELGEFAKFADDKTVVERVRAIKHENKISFANHLARKSGQIIDPHSLYDVQIKRLHEYKRQLLNALNIIGLYLDLRDNADLDIQPQTFIFGAKAAPGYQMAKRIIQLLCMLSREIDRHPRIKEKLSVVFLENYDVSTAEALVPSADISEQISLAGKEASGTGCMKLMMNGALTIGTLDGANVEMLEAVGEDNMFIFGLTSSEVDELWLRGYRSADYYASNERLRRIVNALSAGFGGESFADIASYLLNGHGVADPYMCLADFESYRLTHEKAVLAYRDRANWSRMSLLNTAASGHFAADRSIREYAERFWNIKPIK